LLVPSNSHEPYNTPQREAERFVQSALDAMSAHIAILDEGASVIAVNRAWREFADHNGYTGTNYGVGTNYLTVCDHATRRNSSEAALVSLGIREIMNGKLDEFEMEYPCNSPQQKRWFVVRVSRFEWYGHMRFIVAHQNISELKLIQVEQTQSKRRLEAILNNVNNGILTVDPKGMIRTANRAAARIFDYTLDELLSLPLVALIDEEFQGQVSFRRLSGEYGHELRGKHSDGSIFPIYVTLNELRLDEGNLYTCIIQDITLRKQIENEQMEKERIALALEKERELRELKNRFLSMMSHELRTPLSSISLSYDMLKKYGEVSTPEEREQALDNIHVQVEVLKEMITDVMTLSRGEADGFKIATEDSDLITYCRDVVEEFQFHYHHSHQVDFECDIPVLRAEIDRKLLRRALTNLLTNAIKYTPMGGRVLFRLYVEGKEAFMEVSDSGIGIPPEDQARLFEPFHRALNVDNIPGTGLGLPITKQVMEQHNGAVSFTSELGRGTSFTLRLPLRQT
jgi:PAS domain S-box-containing protein